MLSVHYGFKKDKVKVAELGSRSRLLKQHGRELALARGRIKKRGGEVGTGT